MQKKTWFSLKRWWLLLLTTKVSHPQNKARWKMYCLEWKQDVFHCPTAIYTPSDFLKVMLTCLYLPPMGKTLIYVPSLHKTSWHGFCRGIDLLSKPHMCSCSVWVLTYTFTYSSSSNTCTLCNVSTVQLQSNQVKSMTCVMSIVDVCFEPASGQIS